MPYHSFRGVFFLCLESGIYGIHIFGAMKTLDDCLIAFWTFHGNHIVLGCADAVPELLVLQISGLSFATAIETVAALETQEIHAVSLE